MENSTVALSVIEDLIHWPLPPSDPTVSGNMEVHAGSSAGSLVFSDEQSLNEVPLTAGAAEELDEEPQERQQARYAAVRRLMALALAMGDEWTRREVVPYLLRCLEEEDAQLSFSVGLTIMDFGSLQTHSPSPLTLRDLVPVVARMGESADSGVRLFLVEVVIPTLFFGVPLERNVDLREWSSKYVRAQPCGNDFGETGEDLVVGWATGQGGAAQRGTDRRLDGSRSRGRADSGVADSWDPFQINLHASRLRGSIAHYLNNICKYALERAEEACFTDGLVTHSTVLDRSNYFEATERRDAFRHRWITLVGLMQTMLRSPYVASVAAAVQCVSNLYAAVVWTRRTDENGRSAPASSLMDSVEELTQFTFTVTRTHVGWCIISCTEDPCKELMKLLLDGNIFAVKTSGIQATATDGKVDASDHNNIKTGKTTVTIATDGVNKSCAVEFGTAGCTTSECDVWDVCLSDGDAKKVPNVLFVSIVRSLPLLFNWSGAPKGQLVSPAESGLCFSTVCNMFRCAINPPTSYVEGDGGDASSPECGNRGGSKSGGNFSKLRKDGSGVPLPLGNVVLALESPACRDFTIAEAVLDGLQLLLDELQKPHAVEDFFYQGASSVCFTLREKLTAVRQLCLLYRDCVVHLASVPSWKTRWLTTQRLPELTGSMVMLLCHIGSHHPVDGPSLVEECAVFLSRLHTELWTGPSGDGELYEMVQDEEEEVRCVVGICAARVFTAVGQGMIRLTFPSGVVRDLRTVKKDKCDTDGESAPGRYHTDLSRTGIQCKSIGVKGDSRGLGNSSGIVLLSAATVTNHLPQLFEAVFKCCSSLLQDKEDRVRSGAATALSVLSRTLSTMVTVSEFNTSNVLNINWLDCLNRTTTLFMHLLGDSSAVVQLSLVSELVALLSTRTAVTGKLAAIMGSFGNGEALKLREGALTACLHRLSKHEMWRYRAQYATLLAEMCLRFLAPNSFAAAELDTNHTPRSVHVLEVGLREGRTVEAGRKPRGAVLAEDGMDPLHCFAKEELLPLLVDVLFDKVKAVRDSALQSLVQMCERLSAARRLLKQEGHPSATDLRDNRGRDVLAGALRAIGKDTPHHGTGNGSMLKNQQSLCSRYFYDNEDDVFISDTLWPLIVNSPKAMATYLSRSSLLRIAVRIGVDKRSILLPLFDQLGHDPVLNVRLVVAKELYGILQTSPGGATTGGCINPNALPKIFFTEKEKNGVVLELLRLLVEDRSVDVRDEAAKALKLCF